MQILKFFLLLYTVSEVAPQSSMLLPTDYLVGTYSEIYGYLLFGI